MRISKKKHIMIWKKFDYNEPPKPGVYIVAEYSLQHGYSYDIAGWDDKYGFVTVDDWPFQADYYMDLPEPPPVPEERLKHLKAAQDIDIDDIFK